MNKDKQEEFERSLDYIMSGGMFEEYSTDARDVKKEIIKLFLEQIAKEKSLSYSQAVQDCLGRVPEHRVIGVLNAQGNRNAGFNEAVSEVEESIKSLLK